MKKCVRCKAKKEDKTLRRSKALRGYVFDRVQCNDNLQKGNS